MFFGDVLYLIYRLLEGFRRKNISSLQNGIVLKNIFSKQDLYTIYWQKIM